MDVRVKLPLWKKFVYTAVVVAAVLLALELLLRLCGYGPLAAAQNGADSAEEGPGLPDPFEYFTVCDQRLGFRNRANGSYHAWQIKGNPLVTTDEFGYRNGFGWTAEGTSPIILFVGDSTVFCSEVNNDETGPSEVAKLLGRKHDVRVLNAGVRGYGTLQCKRMLIECLERFPSIKVVVYTHCGNDLEENLLSDMRFPAKTPAVARDEETGQLREVEVSDPAVPWGQSFYGWAPPPSTAGTTEKIRQWLDAHSAVCHHCLVGWRRIVGRPPFEDPDMLNVWARENGGDEVLEKLLLEMDQICRDHGTVLLATSFYSGSDRVTPREFEGTCAAEGIPFVRLEDYFTSKASSYLALRVDGRYDAHYGTLGTKTYAKALAPELDRILRSQTSGSVSGARAGDDDDD